MDMICDWDSLLGVLPTWLKADVNRIGRDSLQELRLRLNRPPELISREGSCWLRNRVRQEDLTFCVNTASAYSPWAAASAAQGYLTLKGGHRIGICGEMVMKGGVPTAFRSFQSLCIRVSRDFPGIGEKAAEISGSLLILGAPGCGKTTLLRDLVRQRSRTETVAVADERGEIFPDGFERGMRTDVLTGCPKSVGILQLLRTMGPQAIAMDEITDPEDCRSLVQASSCGVSLLATAHAGTLQEFQKRPVYRPLLENRIFSHVLILQRDQTYQVERMEL